MKYTLKEKLRFVKLHIEENVPIYEIERKYGFRVDALKYFFNFFQFIPPSKHPPNLHMVRRAVSLFSRYIRRKKL